MSEYFTQTRGTGGNATATTVSSARSIAGTSLTVDSIDNWSSTTGNKVHFITYKKKTDGTKDNSTQCDWSAIIPATGTTLTSLTLLNGTDTGNDVGDFVEMAPTASWGEDLYNGLTAEHNTDGTHGDITATSINVSDNVTLPTGSIVADALADSAVTYTKLLSTIFSDQLTSYSTGGTFYYGTIGGIKIFMGRTARISVAANATAWTVTYPSGFFTTVYGATATAMGMGGTANQYANISDVSYGTSTLNIYTIAGASGMCSVSVFVIGV